MSSSSEVSIVGAGSRGEHRCGDGYLRRRRSVLAAQGTGAATWRGPRRRKMPTVGLRAWGCGRRGRAHDDVG